MSETNDEHLDPLTGPTRQGGGAGSDDADAPRWGPSRRDGQHWWVEEDRPASSSTHSPIQSEGVTDSEKATAVAEPSTAGTPAAEEMDESAKVSKPRRVRLPLGLFIATCLSTFWAGASHWLPIPADGAIRQTLVAHWQEGLIYMACVLAILLAHEMGHFLATVRYRIPASFPYFIPFPISPIGTMGAVIGMDGLRANRKELFDIGLAGPLAGLVIAIPMTWIGITRLDFTQAEYGPFALDLPLFARIAMSYIQPPGYTSEGAIWFSHLNPYFVAGWVGLLITGLNMIPVSQLDGGHVAYTLLGRRAHWIARLIIVLAIVQIVVTQRWTWSLMIVLVLFIGPDHPPTRDDRVPLGRTRTIVGFTSILIPIFCFPVRLLIFPG